MINRTQIEIIKTWPKEWEEVVVSIRCTAYNHEPYIAQTLDGFLMQETNFPFEVIVHDDASTDGTANIIREYEKKYPRIIKPIYEKENQYSKKNGIFNAIINKELKGKYIAICEGDDYWINPNKLQKSFDFLEKNNNYSACTHNTIRINFMQRKQEEEKMFSDEDFDLTLKDIIKRNDFHTSSIVCRRELYLNRPPFCFAQPEVADYPFKIFLTLSGPVKRFGNVMSVYRLGTPNSWTLRVAMSTEKSIQNSINCIKMLCMANDWSGHNFEEIFQPAISRMLYNYFLKLGRFNIIKAEPYRTIWKSDTTFNKVKFFLRFLKNAYVLKNRRILIEQLDDISSKFINQK